MPTSATLSDILDSMEAGVAVPLLPAWPMSYFPPRAFRVPGYDYSGCEDSTVSIEERVLDAAKGETPEARVTLTHCCCCLSAPLSLSTLRGCRETSRAGAHAPKRSGLPGGDTEGESRVWRGRVAASAGREHKFESLQERTEALRGQDHDLGTRVTWGVGGPRSWRPRARSTVSSTRRPLP